MQKGKQYSFWHYLPCSKEKIISLIPRELIKKRSFLKDYNVKIDLSLLLFVINKLTNEDKSESKNPFVEIKRSTLRNFIGKKIHSKKAKELDIQVEKFLEVIKTAENKTLYFESRKKSVIFSFNELFYKMLLSGNTVSFNLLDLTSLRGEKAKKTFLNVLCFDLRVSDKYMKLSNLINYLSLDFKKRKSSIIKIKRALKSLERKNIIDYLGYEYNMSNNKYIFNYKLKDLLQK